MPADFDTGFFGGREPAWHGLGTVIDEDVVTAERALQLAELDWKVIKAPLITVPTFGRTEMEIDIPTHVATVRSDTRRVLGVVGAGYEVIQNEELLEFVAALCDTDEAIFHTAGSLRDGRVIWALAKLSRNVQLLGMEDERIDPFLMATNAHDGSRALTAVMTPVRVVCSNTLNMALRSAIRAWTIRHTSRAKDRIIEAQEALGIAFKYIDALEKTAATLVRKKMTQKEFKAFLEQLVPYDEQMLAGEKERAAKNVDEARAAIRSLYTTSPNLENVRGTKWAALNAVAEYVDFAKEQANVYLADGSLDERTMAERRFVRVVYDNSTKQSALRILDPTLAHGRGDNLALMAAAQ